MSGHLADLSQRLLTIEMLKLPPPIWALVYVLTAAAISSFFGCSKVPGFPLVGERVIVWQVPPRGEKPVVLYFHRNGGALRNRVDRFRALLADGNGAAARAIIRAGVMPWR